MLKKIREDMREAACVEKVSLLQRFFKTGPGEYGEGDVFIGLSMPQARRIAKTYATLPVDGIRTLLHSSVHEERLIALLLLIQRFEAGNEGEKKRVYDFYTSHIHRVNNWDLVDISAHKIVGAYLSADRAVGTLRKYAHSKNMWERRIAIVATLHYIRVNNFKPTIAIAGILRNDEHDLIHKAVGWLLREVGKRSLETEEAFLKKHYKKMPRTMLRYAIERFPERKRKAYLQGNI